MRTHRPSQRPPTIRRLTPREADRLLAGQPAGPDRRALARLLAAAAAPTRPAELAGERTAVEGFARAYRGPARCRPARPPRPARLTRSAIVTSAVVLLVGGAAVAARTLPGRDAATHDAAVPSAPTTSPRPAAPPAVNDPAVNDPAVDLPALCGIYLAGLRDPRAALDPAVVRQLARAASGLLGIRTLCEQTLSGDPPPASAAAAPTTGAAPGGAPGDPHARGRSPCPG